MAIKIDFKKSQREKKKKESTNPLDVSKIILEEILEDLNNPLSSEKRSINNKAIKKFKSELWKSKRYTKKNKIEALKKEKIELLYKKEKVAIFFEKTKKNSIKKISGWILLSFSYEFIEKNIEEALDIVLKLLKGEV